MRRLAASRGLVSFSAYYVLAVNLRDCLIVSIKSDRLQQEAGYIIPYHVSTQERVHWRSRHYLLQGRKDYRRRRRLTNNTW
jgi:hypothetical protein